MTDEITDDIPAVPVPAYPDQETLWAMPSHEFNEWRATNDIPVLFDYLNTCLPGFNIWTNTLPFDTSVMARVVPTGTLFTGRFKKTLIERSSNVPGQAIIECFDGSPHEATEHWEALDQPIRVIVEFEPYARWARRKLGRKRFLVYDKQRKKKTDTFIYKKWEGSNAEGERSTAYLFKDFPVLKLGQVVLPSDTALSSRNLDFTDLDYLVIGEGFHDNAFKLVNFSSCRGLTFKNANTRCLHFYRCYFDELFCEESRIRELVFERSYVNIFHVTASFVHDLRFKESFVMPLIRDSELRELSYSPPSNAPPEQVAASYRLFRSAFQGTGLRHESMDCYYQERVFERKAEFHPYTAYPDLFPSIRFDGSILTVLRRFHKGEIPDGKLFSSLMQAILSRLKIWIFPHYLLRLTRYRFGWLFSLLEALVWGYGTKPARILTTTFALIAGYAALYRHMGWPSEHEPYAVLSWTDSIYFSVVTFTTLGFGDISPQTDLLKIVCATEAILGAFIIGLVIAGFSNRSRY